MFRSIAWLIFIAALLLRLVGLGDYPARHATDDEFSHMWAGLSVIHSGRPISWTGIKSNDKVTYYSATFDERGYRLADPYMDHPPLFGLMSGTFAQLCGARAIKQDTESGKPIIVWDVNLGRARLLMVAIFAATFWLLLSLTRNAYTPAVALITALFYAFMSHAVAHGRLIMADNFTALLLVAAAWCIQRWISARTSERKMGITVATLTAGAILTKIPAWCIVPALMVCLALTRNPAAARYVVFGFAAGVALYIGWIGYFGFDAFVATMASQSGRFRGFNAFQLMSGVPRLLAVMDLNGIIIAGWFCMLVQALRNGASPLTAIGPVYVLAFTFFAGDFLFGWYVAPLYPLFALALGLTTVQVFREPRSTQMAAWLLLMLPHAFQTLYIARYDLETVLRYTHAVVVAVLVLAFFFKQPRSEKVLRVALIAILAVVYMREVYEVVNQRTDRLTDQEKYLR